MFIPVTPYDPSWPVSFQKIRSSLSVALHGVEILSIEHVGSTSIPGLAGKPCIDIDIVTTRPNIPPAIAALQKAGYSYGGEKGMVDRHSFEAPPRVSEVDGREKIKSNIYLCLDDSLSLKNHLAVRNVLTNDQELRDEYGRVKMALAERDLESFFDYVEGKSEVLRKILGRAGLELEELDEIEVANKSMRLYLELITQEQKPKKA